MFHDSRFDARQNTDPDASGMILYDRQNEELWDTAQAEAEKLRLEDNHFYLVLLGELYGNTNPEKAKKYFEKNPLPGQNTAGRTNHSGKN